MLNVKSQEAPIVEERPKDGDDPGSGGGRGHGQEAGKEYPTNKSGKE